MNTTATQMTALQPLISTTTRFAVALAVAGVLALVSMVAAQASHQAVATATASFSQTAPAPFRLETVQVVGRRETTNAKRI